VSVRVRITYLGIAVGGCSPQSGDRTEIRSNSRQVSLEPCSFTEWLLLSADGSSRDRRENAMSSVKLMEIRIGTVMLDVPRTLGHYGGVALAVVVGVVKLPLGALIAAVPVLKLLPHQSERQDERAKQLLLVFDALEGWMATENYRGCGFINAQAELPDGDHPGRRVIGEDKVWLLGYLRELAERANVRNPRRLAYSLLILLEGATVTASLGVVPSAIGNAKQVAKVLIDAA
jgi:hypothetical protein